MNRIPFITLSALLCTLLLLSFVPKKPEKELIKVLIIDGFSNHDWKQTSKVAKAILEESGLFNVDISTMPSAQTDSAGWANWNPNFAAYRVVIQNTNNINRESIRWPRAVELQLENYVQSGGGLYVLHSGNNAFPHWKEYDQMIGLGWRTKDAGSSIEIVDGKAVIIPPGQGQGTNHGKRFNAGITRLTPHPITSGFPDRWLTADMEVYTYPRGPVERLTVLSYALDTLTHKNWPVEWTVRYGKGNVYNSSMGHLWAGEKYPIAYRCIGFQTTMIRAAEWLATGKVTYPVPANFPGITGISVRKEDDFPGQKKVGN